MVARTCKFKKELNPRTLAVATSLARRWRAFSFRVGLLTGRRIERDRRGRIQGSRALAVSREKRPVVGRRRAPGKGTPAINTKAAALEAERAHIERVQKPPRVEVPTFHDWFNCRFWSEWVVGRQNKPTERRSKERVYAKHLRKPFGDLPLDRIGVAEIAQFRAKLAGLKGRRGKPLSAKRINLILCVLSRPLKYAEDCGLIAKAPKVGLLKAERPEIVA